MEEYIEDKGVEQGREQTSRDHVLIIHMGTQSMSPYSFEGSDSYSGSSKGVSKIKDR